ncbi:MAG: hypothetical protein ACLR4Z_01600 [Butyricicoccaceae bacterium]
MRPRTGARRRAKPADDEGYETFVVPDDIGGRFSVLTPVGLLPMAAAGVNIDEVMEWRGAGAYREPPRHRPSRCKIRGASAAFLHRKGKSMEIPVS